MSAHITISNPDKEDSHVYATHLGEEGEHFWENLGGPNGALPHVIARVSENGVVEVRVAGPGLTV